jgi:putative ABC transport system permease protein
LQGLVTIVEIALSFVLLIAAGLLTQSLFRMVAARPAIRPELLLSIRADFSSPKYRQKPAIVSFTNEVMGRLRSLSGVDAVTVAESAPFGGADFDIVGIKSVEFGQTMPTMLLSDRSILPNYFSVLGIPIVLGRPFTEAENSDDAPVVMINKAMAQKFWSLDTAIDKQIQLRGRWYSVIGVVADSRELDFSLASDTLPTFYLTKGQGGGVTFLIRSGIDPAVLTPMVRQQIAAVDKDMPLDNIQTVESLIQKSIAPDRYRTMLINIFAIMAASLALIGLYGVVSRTVVQRTRELSIRVALGAKPGSVFWMVLRQSLQLTAIGIVIGILSAVALTRTLSDFLFDIRPTDFATYVAVAIGLLLVSLLSTYLPARRAAKTDPMIALRTE